MSDPLNLKELLSQIKKRFYKALFIPTLTLLLVCYIFSVNKSLSKIIAFVALFALIRGMYAFFLYIKQIRAYNKLVTTSAIIEQQASTASDRIAKILISTIIILPEEPLNLHPASEALFRHINEKRLDDPMIGIKLGSEEINQVLIESLTSDRGVHIESLLVILGSLAGFACRASVRFTLRVIQ